MSDPVRVPPSGGPGHWRRWLLPVLASAAWLVLTFCLYRHAVQGEQAHLLELCHTRLAATAHQLMDARDWNAGHGGVYVPLSAYGEPNPWLPEKDRTLQTADGRTLVLMNPAYMSRQMAERLTEPGFRLAIVGQAPLRPGNRADDWERRILATATQGGQVFFSGEDCLPQGRLRLLRTLAAQESCLRCHQGHKEGDMLGGISISMDAAAYVRDLERKQRELGLLYGLLALTGVLAVGGITSNLTLRRLQAEEKSRLKSAFMGRLSHDMRTPLAAMLGMSDLLDRQDCGTEQRHTALAYLRRACGALLEMVDDITDHASLEQGDVRLRCRTFDLPACLRACADLYRPAAEGKGLELLLHLAPHLPRQVRGDDFRLRQALGNLVSNAVKFTERGRVDVEAGGGRLASGVFLLRLDVRDSGPGLEPGEERTVFESFCRGSAAGGKPGTGLGLNIVRTIARRMAEVKIPASRLSEEEIGGVKVIMQMSKDKNALACSRNFDYIRSKPGKKELLLMMNCLGVAKSWSENPSWMYDTDFEFLNSDDVTCLVCAGPRAYDYQLRLLLAGIPRQKIRLAEDEFAALELLPLTPGDDVYLLYGVDGTPLAFRVREKLKEKLLAKEGAQ